MVKTPALKFTFIISILLSSINLFSQQNPSGIDWKSIDTGTYEIIFPAEIAPLGQRVANLMVHYEKYNYSSIKTEPRRIPIVLINNYAEPNGFVSFAPFYSHWFTTPSSFDSIEWFKGLAIHEGRHMVQQNKLKDGPGETIWRVLLGETGTAYLSILYVPVWFFEGDSVVMETALTKGGRGRSPYFNLWQRGIELSDSRETYYESFLGSYDSLSPYTDHYRLGYLLCSYVRKHYGKEVFDKVLKRTGRYFFWYTFGSALRKETGKTIDQIYNSALDEYRGLWIEQQKELKITNADILNPKQNDAWDSYIFPSVNEDGNLTAVRFTGTRKLSLVEFKENNEMERIKQLPFDVASTFLMNERIYTTGGNSALWRENIPDPRWGYRSYSDLKILDVKTGKTRFITDKGKYITSAISSDGKLAAGIEYGTDLKYFLSVIDTGTTEEIFREEIKDKGYLFDPAISPDNKNIALTALSDNGYALLLYNLETKSVTPLINYTDNEHLRAPVFYNNYIIYGSDYSGIDNIYAVDIKTKQRFQITSRPLGAYFPSVNGDNLCFNDYSIYGYNAASMKLNRNEWVPIEKTGRRVINYIEPIAEQELGGDLSSVDNIPDNEYPVKNYYPILNSINFYGWFPFLNATPTDFTISIFSQDVHQTTDIVLSYIHNFNENKDAGEISVIYSGLYPVFSLKGGYGGRAAYLPDESDEENIYMTWKEATGSGGVSLPLNFSRGVHSTFINFGADTGYIKITDKNYNNYSIYEELNYDGDLHYMQYFLTFSHLIQGAKDSVTPGTGEVLNVYYVDTPYGGDYKGSLFSADLSLYLPGITDMQGTKISGAYEQIKYDTYIFPQQFLFPRGYDSVRYEELYKASIDYAFPIINFSANIWKLIYFKRINGDIFFDYGVGKTDEELTYYRSAGVEITAEHNWLSNKFLALEIGVRYSRCFDADEDAKKNNDKNRYEMVLKTPI
jgi:hypothetical protein